MANFIVLSPSWQKSGSYLQSLMYAVSQTGHRVTWAESASTTTETPLSIQSINRPKWRAKLPLFGSFYTHQWIKKLAALSHAEHPSIVILSDRSLQSVVAKLNPDIVVSMVGRQFIITAFTNGRRTDSYFDMPEALDLRQFNTTHPRPDSLPNMPLIAGYMGPIDDLDFKLLERIAFRLPHWRIVILGMPKKEQRNLIKLPNIECIECPSEQQRIAFLKHWNVTIIPKMTMADTTVHSQHIRESFAAGTPVVTIDTPDFKLFKGRAQFGFSGSSFANAIVRAGEQSIDRRCTNRLKVSVRDQEWSKAAFALLLVLGLESYPQQKIKSVQ